MAKRDEAAPKPPRWEPQGYGPAGMEAPLGQPDKKLADAVDLIEQEVAEMIRRESGRRARGTYVMHLPVGRLVVMTGEDASSAALFRRAPGKDVVQVLVKTVEAIEENRAAATKTFGNDKLAGKYAEALLKLLQKTSL